MSNLIRFTGTGEAFKDLPMEGFNERIKWTHAHGQSSDYTLCGDTLDGDDNTLGAFRNVEVKYVTCPTCVRIIRYCQTLKVKP